MKKLICLLAAGVLTLGAYAQEGQRKEPKATPKEIKSLRKAVRKDFNNPKAHEDYIYAAGAESKKVQAQYDKWIRKNPRSVAIPFAFATALYEKELPAAKPYLEQVVKLDPKNGEAYQMLWIDAERWGDFAAGREYLRKATEADPANPNYAFYYASSFSEADSARHHQMMLDVPKRFPGTERGAQALYWLAQRSRNPKVKAEVWEMARKQFDPGKNGWAMSAMNNYYGYLLANDAPKAQELAAEMLRNDSLRTSQQWLQNKAVADAIVGGRALAAQGKYAEAMEQLAAAPRMRYGSTIYLLLKEKAMTNHAMGNTAAAYDSLLRYYAVEPTEEVYGFMTQYGGKLGKNDAAIQADVWNVRKAASKPATAFSLDNYMTAGKTSLESLKGKVVLVTYWFPGCGPCRGEFPHFEAVVRKYGKDQLAYVGINIAHEQDPYVVPFMNQSGYSFTPVRDEPEKRGNLIARGAPTNYLIDKEGNIVFSNFRTDGHNQRTLELMINELLDK